MLFNTNGETMSNYDRVNEVVTTTFDSQKYIGGSELGIARTILHESVHAYLVAYFGVSANASTTYSKYVDDYYDVLHGDMNAAQHNEMVRSFVAGIASELKTFGISRGYKLTDEFYNDLSWGGLTETRAFKAFNGRAAGRILDVISIEQNGHNVYGGVSVPKGKPSGCQ